jgi:peptide/nickel transport system permease protein
VGAVVLASVAAAALFAPAIASFDPLAMVARPLIPPFQDLAHPLGTDRLGRDVLSGLVHGARVSLFVGLVVALATLGVGTLVGLAAGFAGGVVDSVLMRVTEAVQTVPTFLLALALTGVLGPSLATVIAAIAFASWPLPARLVRAQVLRVRTLDYVDAARLAGLAPLRIALVVVLPGAVAPVLALFAVAVAEAILVESALAFLGLSDPNVRSWGAMVAEGRALVRTAPHVALLPGAAIALTVLAISLVGDRLGVARRRLW